MNFLNKMERKLGRYAIHNLSAFIIAAYIAGYIMTVFSPAIISYLTLEPYFILKGQIWRIVTWILVPPGGLGIFTIIMLFFYYSVGTALERQWGAFLYNVYIFSGVLFTVIGAFLLYFIMHAVMGYHVTFGSLFSTYYINMSIFLAFSATYPDATVLLYFFIPLKIKWLGILYGVLIAVEFFQNSWVVKVAILTSLLNFIIFMLLNRNTRRFSYKEHMRKKQFTQAFTKRETDNRSEGSTQQRTGRSGSTTITRHRCAVCGRTELDGEMLEFRFCSRCNGNYEYCQDHLFTHEHVK